MHLHLSLNNDADDDDDLGEPTAKVPVYFLNYQQKETSLGLAGKFIFIATDS